MSRRTAIEDVRAICYQLTGAEMFRPPRRDYDRAFLERIGGRFELVAGFHTCHTDIGTFELVGEDRWQEIKLD